MKVFRWLLLSLVYMNLALAQSDPGAKEDKEAEREKLLRAADQLDNMTTQVEALRVQSDQQKAQVEALKSQVAEVKNDNAQLKDDIVTLKAAVEKLDAAREQERDVILKKVGELVAEALKNKPAPPPDEPKVKATEATTESTVPVEPVTEEKGYYYIVKKGDTLHDIVTAYQGQGVKVTVEDLRKANKISKTAYLHVGQKLFIPKN